MDIPYVDEPGLFLCQLSPLHFVLLQLIVCMCVLSDLSSDPSFRSVVFRSSFFSPS